jgi:WD40 repeat protein
MEVESIKKDIYFNDVFLYDECLLIKNPIYAQVLYGKEVNIEIGYLNDNNYSLNLNYLDENFTFIKISPDGNFLAAISEDNLGRKNILIFDTKSGKNYKKYLCFQLGNIFKCSFSADSKILVFSTRNDCFRYFEISKGSEKAPLETGKEIFSFDFSNKIEKDGSEFFFVCSKDKINEYKYKNNKFILQKDFFEKPSWEKEDFQDIVCSQNGSMIAGITKNNVFIFIINSMKLIKKIEKESCPSYVKIYYKFISDDKQFVIKARKAVSETKTTYTICDWIDIDNHLFPRDIRRIIFQLMLIKNYHDKKSYENKLSMQLYLNIFQLICDKKYFSLNL